MLLYESVGHNEKLHQDIDLEGQEGLAIWCWRLVHPRRCASGQADFKGSDFFGLLPQTVE